MTSPAPPPSPGQTLYGTANGAKFPFRTVSGQDTELNYEADVGAAYMRVDCAPGGSTTATDKIVQRGIRPVCVIASTSSYDYPANTISVTQFGNTCGSEALALVNKASIFDPLNEPDLHGWAGHADAWFPYQQACYNAIKAWQPNALVLFPGMFEGCGTCGNTVLIDYVSQYYATSNAAGGARYFDAMNVHAYGDFATDCGARAMIAHVWGCPGSIYDNGNNVRAIMNANGDSAKPIVCTECGQTVNAPFSEAIQATDVSNALHAADGVGTGYRKTLFTLIYNMENDDVAGFGMLRDDLSKRPSYCNFKLIAAGSSVC